MTNRYDYVAYDNKAKKQQEDLKNTVTYLDGMISSLDNTEYRKDAIKHLEICYMYIGKSIRDDQIKRNGSAPLQESRDDS